MKIAHVRERHGPTGAPWRLAAALDRRGRAGPMARPRGRPAPRRCRGSAARPQLDAASAAARDPRRPPRARAARREPARARRRLQCPRRGGRGHPGRRRSRFGPPILRPPTIRDFYAFEGHVRTDVGTARRRGAGELVPPARLLLQQRVGNPRPGRARLAAGGIVRARLRAGGGCAGRHAGGRPGARSEPRKPSVASRSSTTGRLGTCSATRRSSGSARPRARISRARSGPASSRRTSWRTPEPATDTR